jgi:phosphohistidine phosphatase SixA
MKFDKIIIECSPFMRTMQTASSIAEALGVEEVEINYLSTEHLYTDFPDANPVPNLWS